MLSLNWIAHKNWKTVRKMLKIWLQQANDWCLTSRQCNSRDNVQRHRCSTDVTTVNGHGYIIWQLRCCKQIVNFVTYDAVSYPIAPLEDVNNENHLVLSLRIIGARCIPFKCGNKETREMFINMQLATKEWTFSNVTTSNRNDKLK